MAQVVVDSNVMRTKAEAIKGAADKIQTLYTTMLNEVNTTAGKMKGTTIETEQKQFASMKASFETFVADIKNYSIVLPESAEAYETAEANGTQEAQQQGKIF